MYLRTNVVCLIKDDHCLLGKVVGDHFSNLRVQQIRVVEHHHISLLELRVRGGVPLKQQTLQN